MQSSAEVLKRIADVLTPDLQTRLLGRTADSVDWLTASPKDINRAMIVSEIIFSLQGAFNSQGISAWFSRPRPQLGGKTADSILQGDWDEDSDDVKKVRCLAHYLRGPINSTPAAGPV